MVQVAHNKAQNHGNDASHQVLHRERTHARGTQGHHGQEGSVIDCQDGSGANVHILTILRGQGRIDNAVGVGNSGNDAHGSQAQHSNSSEDGIEAHANGKADKEFDHRQKDAAVQRGAGHLDIDLRTAAEQEQANDRGNSFV